jgi:hypothetical protein
MAHRTQEARDRKPAAVTYDVGEQAVLIHGADALALDTSARQPGLGHPSLDQGIARVPGCPAQSHQGRSRAPSRHVSRTLSNAARATRQACCRSAGSAFRSCWLKRFVGRRVDTPKCRGMAGRLRGSGRTHVGVFRAIGSGRKTPGVVHRQNVRDNPQIDDRRRHPRRDASSLSNSVTRIRQVHRHLVFTARHRPGQRAPLRRIGLVSALMFRHRGLVDTDEVRRSR